MSAPDAVLVKRSLLAGAIGAALILAAPVQAAEVGWSAGVGVGHTDNATRVETDTVSDTIAALSGSLDLSHESRRVEASLVGHLTHLSYLDDTYDDDLLARAVGKLSFAFVPERFFWVVEDTFGQNAINEFQPVTPENRQNVNVFSTGPDAYLRFGSNFELRLSGRYGSTSYERSTQVDETRLLGEAELLRRVSATSAWGIAGSAARIEYDLPGNPGYDQQALYGTLQAEGARQDIRVDLGINQVADAGESYSDPLIRINWNRQLTPSWTMNLNAGSEYQNSSDRFVGSVEVPGGDSGTGNVTISGIPSATYYGGVTFGFERPRTRLSAGARYSQENFIRSGQPDRDTWSLRAGASRRFTPRVQGFVDAAFEQREFGGLTLGSDDTVSVAAWVDWGLGRTVFLTAGYRFEDRSSDGVGQQYTENLIYLSVSYRHGPVESRAFRY